jgi:hypothetical protein
MFDPYPAFFGRSNKNLPADFSEENFMGPFLCFAAEISASWQH